MDNSGFQQSKLHNFPHMVGSGSGSHEMNDTDDKQESSDLVSARNEMPRLVRRLVDAQVDIMAADEVRPEFLHSVLCQVGMPRKRTQSRTFERNSGNCSIRVEAGRLFEGNRKGWVEKVLPYGARPRLVLLHLCAEAVRTQDPNIEVGRTAHEFLRRLGIDSNGDGYRRFREQMEGLAACRMQLGLGYEERNLTVDTKPISRFDAWLQLDEGAPALWPGIMTLSAEFMTTLMAHAVPLDPRAIKALQGSALALDVYAWLAHRLCRIRKKDGVKLAWKNLREQFGQEYSNSRDFKREMKATLMKVCAVYPDARISEETGGIRLYSSPPPIRKTSSLVALPGR